MVSDSQLIAEAERILREAKAQNLILKLMGALAFRIQCSRSSLLFENLNRQLTDMDFASFSRQGRDVINFLARLGYAPDRNTLTSQEYGSKRLMFEYPDPHFHVDVFLDELSMCHTINFKSRLMIEEKTISLADMILEKMQIVQIAEKDVIDTIALLGEHKVGDIDSSCINAKYISEIMRDDWGFYYTFTNNLRKVREALRDYEQLPREISRLASENANKILEAVELEPKSLKWQLRAKIGPKKKWYNDVISAM